MNGPICGVENCRSGKYEEGEDGFLYCQNGHRQHGLVRGEDDEDNYTTATRTVTRKKKEIEDEDKKAAKHFSGRLGFDLYLKCLQLILRHQLWFLIHDRGLPAELESIVYDLWALRIAQFSDRIASGHQEIDSQSQTQIFNTLETEESDATDKEHGSSKTRKGKRDKKMVDEPNLKDCFALCYLGILTLRLPFTPGDIYKWITDRRMPYFRAIKLLPLPMRDRLPPHYHAVLDPNAMFKYSRFYAAVTELQLSFVKDHGILWPALNVPILLYRYLKELILPLEIYDATTRLGELLGYEYVLPHDSNKRLGVRHLPEAQLIGCLIVCVKLFYPLDSKRRQPRSSVEPTAIALDWDDWCQQINPTKTGQQDTEKRFTTEDLLHIGEKDVFAMNTNQTDQYLDFYMDTFLDQAAIQRTKDSDDFRHALYNMFPVENDGHDPIRLSDGPTFNKQLDAVRAVHSNFKVVATVAGDQGSTSEGVLRPGQAYPSWKVEQDLPEQAHKFYMEAARLVGLSMDMLILVVCSVEAKIEKWRRQQMREKAALESHEDHNQD